MAGRVAGFHNVLRSTRRPRRKHTVGIKGRKNDLKPVITIPQWYKQATPSYTFNLHNYVIQLMLSLDTARFILK